MNYDLIIYNFIYNIFKKLFNVHENQTNLSLTSVTSFCFWPKSSQGRRPNQSRHFKNLFCDESRGFCSLEILFHEHRFITN